jgi:hypothetical protein
MAMAWMGTIPQLTLIKEAQSLARRHMQDTFAEVRGLYGAYGFDVMAFSQELLARCDEALSARASSNAAEGRYEVEASQARKVVDDADLWLRRIGAAASYAASCEHPLGEEGLSRLFANAGLRATTSMGAITAVREALTNLDLVDDLRGYGLPDGFAAEGAALVVRLQKEEGEAELALGQRHNETSRLHTLLEQILAMLERIARARDYVMLMTGKELPGLELSYARSAQAGPGPKPAPAAAAPPAEPAAPAPATTPGEPGGDRGL